MTLVANSGFYGDINVNLMFKMDLVAHWSGSTNAAIQWFDVSCGILSFLFDILEILSISSKLVILVTFCMTFFQNFRKGTSNPVLC